MVLNTSDRVNKRTYVGQGGMGVVYKAWHPQLERLVAIKLMKPQPDNNFNNLKRFRREAQAASQMQHPNTNAVYAFGVTSDGQLYFILEYLDGKSLATIFGADERYPLDGRIIQLTSPPDFWEPGIAQYLARHQTAAAAKLYEEIFRDGGERAFYVRSYVPSVLHAVEAFNGNRDYNKSAKLLRAVLKKRAELDIADNVKACDHLRDLLSEAESMADGRAQR